MNTRKLILSLIAMLGLGVFSAISAHATTWYVRDGGGTAAQCTGTTNALYAGSGTNQPCAFNHPRIALGYCDGYESNPGNPPCSVKGVMASGDTMYIDGDSDINTGSQAQYEMGYDDVTAGALTPGCQTAYAPTCNTGDGLHATEFSNEEI
jgi:hypothetical protein